MGFIVQIKQFAISTSELQLSFFLETSRVTGCVYFIPLENGAKEITKSVTNRNPRSRARNDKSPPSWKMKKLMKESAK